MFVSYFCFICIFSNILKVFFFCLFFFEFCFSNRCCCDFLAVCFDMICSNVFSDAQKMRLNLDTYLIVYD